VIKFFFRNHLCRFDHILRHKKTVGKIIRTSGRNISDRYIASCFHNSGNNFVKSAVTSTAYDQINRICIFFGFFIGITRCLRSTDNDFIIMSAENIYDIQEVHLDPALSCFGIKNKKHFFSHGLMSPFFLISYAFYIIQQIF